MRRIPLSSTVRPLGTAALKLPITIVATSALLSIAICTVCAQTTMRMLHIEFLPELGIRLSWTNANAVVQASDELASTNNATLYSYNLDHQPTLIALPDGSSVAMLYEDGGDYDAATARWTTKDPLGFAGGVGDLYAYAANDPVNLKDPLGSKPGDIILRPKNFDLLPRRHWWPRLRLWDPYVVAKPSDVILAPKGDLAPVRASNVNPPRPPRAIPKRPIPPARFTGFSGVMGGFIDAGMTVLTMTDCHTVEGIFALARQGSGGLANRNADRLYKQIDKY